MPPRLASLTVAANQIDRLVSLGARRLDDGQCTPDAVPMADPDGNAFCLRAHQ